MIKVEKDFTAIPDILMSKPIRGQSREEVFFANIEAGKYIDKKHSYKVPSIQKQLLQIYHYKCAYCEKKLIDSPKHIEHYRPKNGGYYWLAYSWDNLLLCCGECNSAKGNRFATQNNKVNYNVEAFENIHNLGQGYDEIEKPMIINPEKDDLLHYIAFTKQGFIYSKHPRVKHTIFKACNLNRDELIELRIEIFNNFKNDIYDSFHFFVKHRDISLMYSPIEKFFKKCNKNEAFYSFRYYILNNITKFFQEKPIQIILQALIQKLLQKEN